jgi:hypothetical protein
MDMDRIWTGYGQGYRQGYGQGYRQIDRIWTVIKIKK